MRFVKRDKGANFSIHGPDDAELALLGLLILVVFIVAGLVWLRDAWATLQPRKPSSVESDFGP